MRTLEEKGEREIEKKAIYGCFNKYRRKNCGLHHILRSNWEVLTVLSHMLKLLISTARLAHIECIFPSIRHPRWVVTIIINHPPEDGVSANIHVSGQYSIHDLY
jgi:hypothetical protein